MLLQSARPWSASLSFAPLALDTPSLGLGASASFADVERAARRHVLAEANLTGFYQR